MRHCTTNCNLSILLPLFGIFLLKGFSVSISSISLGVGWPPFLTFSPPAFEISIKRPFCQSICYSPLLARSFFVSFLFCFFFATLVFNLVFNLAVLCGCCCYSDGFVLKLVHIVAFHRQFAILRANFASFATFRVVWSEKKKRKSLKSFKHQIALWDFEFGISWGFFAILVRCFARNVDSIGYRWVGTVLKAVSSIR